MHPIARAFGNEEFLEPAEEALVRRCTLVDTYYNFTNAATKESDNDSAFGTVRIEEADSMMDDIDSISRLNTECNAYFFTKK